MNENSAYCFTWELIGESFDTKHDPINEMENDNLEIQNLKKHKCTDCAL